MILLDYGVQFVTRAEWGARQPTSITGINPSFGSTRHWEGPHMGVFPHESCASKVRGIQAFHMDGRGWTDIAYTGVACPHGYLFEGRGLWRRTAANGTNVGNNTAYAFCYLGGEGDPFTEGGKRAVKAGMNWAARSGGAGPGRNDHNDWKATQCPGVVIETWGDTGELLTEPAPPPIPTAYPEDLMPLPVIAVPGDPLGRDVYKAIYPGGYVELTDIPGGPTGWERYQYGVVAGLYQEVEAVDARAHDVALAEALRLVQAPVPVDVNEQAIADAVIAALPPLNAPGAFEVSFTGAATATPTAPADQPAG